jgi:hypothetical protein
MLEDLIAAISRVGLSMHARKTMILTNQTGGSKCLNAAGTCIDILAPEESTMYLGRKFSLHRLHDTEVDNRIQQAWRKYWAHRTELCGKGYRLKDRLRLFNAVVTPSVLYSCGTWTMTTERTRRLRTAQRMMLRKVINTKRKLITEITASSSSGTSSECSYTQKDDDTLLEPWVDWIKRAARVAEAQTEMAGIPDWAGEQLRRKYRMAGHFSRREDNRWATKVLYWVPEGGTRRRGHPEQRWTDDIDNFFNKLLEATPGEWRDIADDPAAWKSYEDEFVAFYAM